MAYGNVVGLFDSAAKRFPAHPAVRHAGSVTRYDELDARADALAAGVVAAGGGRGAVVAILTEDPVAVIAAVIAVLRTGGLFVSLDPRVPRPRLEAMLAVAAPAVLVGDSALLAGFAGAHVAVDGALPAASAPADPAGPDDPCYLYFTSGSTGEPKAIVGRSKGVDHFVQWEIRELDVDEGTRVSQLTSPAFDAFLRDVFVPLGAGGTVCIPPRRDIATEPRALVEWIDGEGIEVVHCVPSVFRAILNAEPAPERFAALRYVLMSGEPLLPTDVARWMERFGERVQLVNLYGPSETTMVKLVHRVTAADRDRRSVPIGRPMPGAAVIVVGSRGEPCPDGAIGEIYIRTPFRSLGYHGRPDLTAECFVPNPFSDDPADLVYKTGDFGRMLDDGSLEFLGRRDHQVKIRGFRVELPEVENAVRAHPAVRDVAVVDRDDPSGGKSLCAYVVMEEGRDPAELRPFLLEQLPEALVPTWYVAMDALPRTITGKVDRRTLPPPAELRPEREVVGPRTTAEEVLAEIWREVLGVPRVDVRDNFFSIGGHSLLATQVLSRVDVGLGVRIPLGTFFDDPTLQGLAAAVERAVASEVMREMETLSDSDVARLLAAGGAR